MRSIPVLGMDPSLRNWGLASAELDLETGVLSTPVLSLIETKPVKGKQVRQNSKDLHSAQQLAERAFAEARKHKAVFVEVPHGSQSANAMKGYGICIGLLAAMRAEGIPFVEVSATEVKFCFTGDKEASKMQMIGRAMVLYPQANFPMNRGKVADKAEHVADAIAAIHAGVKTPFFQNLMRMFKSI
jgi:Holliday junction resolvasome RuvABC endonuclease subunit